MIFCNIQKWYFSLLLTKKCHKNIMKYHCRKFFSHKFHRWHRFFHSDNYAMTQIFGRLLRGSVLLYVRAWKKSVVPSVSSVEACILALPTAWATMHIGVGIDARGRGHRLPKLRTRNWAMYIMLLLQSLGKCVYDTFYDTSMILLWHFFANNKELHFM